MAHTGLGDWQAGIVAGGTLLPNPSHPIPSIPSIHPCIRSLIHSFIIHSSIHPSVHPLIRSSYHPHSCPCCPFQHHLSSIQRPTTPTLLRYSYTPATTYSCLLVGNQFFRTVLCLRAVPSTPLARSVATPVHTNIPTKLITLCSVPRQRKREWFALRHRACLALFLFDFPSQPQPHTRGLSRARPSSAQPLEQ